MNGYAPVGFESATSLLAPGPVPAPVEEKRKRSFNVELTSSRVRPEEVMNLSRQLSAFLSAGLPILDAVALLREEAGNPAMGRVLLDVEDGLRSGDSMADCFDRHPKVFPAFYRGVLRSAELTGQLDLVLDQLSSYLERDLEAKRKIKSALIYPAIVAVLSVVTVAVLAGFVLPRFQKFFENLGAELPLPTRMLLAGTDFLVSWWFLIVAGLALLGTGLFLALRTTSGRLVKDRLSLRVPVLRDVVQFALVERFCRILGSMLAAGVTLPEALRVATGSLNNLVYTRALSGVHESLLEGDGLARPLSETGLFPVTAAQMVRVGEDSGSLDVQLEVAARYYEKELDYKIKRFTSVFEPAVIVVMGLVVGFVAVALISAMYGIFNQMGPS